jgi:non-homologous end joining protein Ku
VAPRAYWKGYLKLSLVSCPIALYPATSEREKISFHQLNKSTGHRIKYRKVDADTGDEVESTDIIKGYQVGKGEYLELEPEELEAIAIESKRTIEIDEFVPRKEIDELYLNSPYYIVPDGEVGQQRKNTKGHARSGFAHRREQGRALRAGALRGSIRRRIKRAAEEEAVRPKDRGAART